MESSEIMSQNVEVISADDTLITAANLMTRHDVRVLRVHNGDQFVSDITDRDINARVLIAGRDPRTTRVRELMEIA